MKPASLQSRVLGMLSPDPESSAMPTLTASATWTNSTQVQVTLVGLKTKTNWEKLLARAEDLFPRLRKLAGKWLLESADDIGRLHEEYFGSEPGDDATRLLSHLEIVNLNFSDDGTIEIWYKGDRVFRNMNVCLSVNRHLVVTDVCIDG